jgi:hypothetical protein
MEIDIGLMIFMTLIVFQAQLSDKWFDFMLVHTFAKNVVSSKNKYFLLIL